MKKIAIFGCKSTTQVILKALSKNHDISYLITIDETLGDRNKVADYCDLRVTAESLKISVYQAKSYNLEDAVDKQTINGMKIDLAFVIGWQRLIPNDILQTIEIGVFGMHGSSMDLPLGRGRSPMNWSILENRNHFYTNLFKYDAGVDSGDILDTFLFSITSNDTAETMHFKNTLAMQYLINKNLPNLLDNNFSLKKQKEISPTYYPKRSPKDSLVNWERDIFYIERHIRAVTKPFNGAYSFINDEKIEIYRATIFETEIVDFGYKDEPAGKIIEVFPNGKFLVKCQSGLLIVHDFKSDKPILEGTRFCNGNETINYFKLNKFGNFDTDN